MTMKSVIEFFAVVKEDKSLQRKTQMAIDIDTIIEIAGDYNYKFTSTELQSFSGYCYRGLRCNRLPIPGFTSEAKSWLGIFSKKDCNSVLVNL